MLDPAAKHGFNGLSLSFFIELINSSIMLYSQGKKSSICQPVKAIASTSEQV